MKGEASRRLTRARALLYELKVLLCSEVERDVVRGHLGEAGIDLAVGRECTRCEGRRYIAHARDDDAAILVPCQACGRACSGWLVIPLGGSDQHAKKLFGSSPLREGRIQRGDPRWCPEIYRPDPGI